jgi:predicted NACHT family NTPase
MQADDRAEYEAERVGTIFADVLDEPDRAARLLEHIRYRTGLLLERRPGIFALAHLTFQEYLAARAILDGNRRGIEPEHLIAECADPRWKEVIALYCGQAPARSVRTLIEGLIDQENTRDLAEIVVEAFISSKSEIIRDE